MRRKEGPRRPLIAFRIAWGGPRSLGARSSSAVLCSFQLKDCSNNTETITSDTRLPPVNMSPSTSASLGRELNTTTQRSAVNQAQRKACNNGAVPPSG